MATCVQASVLGGTVSVINPPPADITTCTMLLVSPAELSTMWPPLSIGDAVVIGSAIWLCWMVVYGFRVLRRQADDHSSTSAQE